MGEIEKFLNDYIKVSLGEVLKKEYPELKEFQNSLNEQKKIISKLEDKIKELEMQLYDRKYTDKIIISSRCSGEHRTRSFEVYSEILEEFMNFKKGKKETTKELVSQALLDLINKYKKDGGKGDKNEYKR